MSDSILQDWVTELPIRAQGGLLVAIRGCDLTPKYPLDSVERKLVGAIRYACLNPADPREVDITPGSFFVSAPPRPAGDNHQYPPTPGRDIDLSPRFKWSELGHYPWHWLSHLVHAIEIIGYYHPKPEVARRWLVLYVTAVESFHMNPEGREQLHLRLTEDRIAAGTVVS